MQIALSKFDGKLRDLKNGEEGHDVVEFALLVGLIALLCLTSVSSVAFSIPTLFSNISGALATGRNKSAAPNSGVRTGGDIYSVRSFETKGQSFTPPAARATQKQQFVDELQQKLERDPGVNGKIQVEQKGDVLILTGPPGEEMPPELLRSTVASELGDAGDDRLCSMGFGGVRIRSGPSDDGAFQSFHCDSASQ
jgi:Flp pilus assembly pilin Flp